MKVVGLFRWCPPAIVYAVLSVTFLLLMMYQNRYYPNVYCVGENCGLTNWTGIYLVKAVFILFWVWVLNILCANNFGFIAWLFVLIPPVVYAWLLWSFVYAPIQ